MIRLHVRFILSLLALCLSLSNSSLAQEGPAEIPAQTFKQERADFSLQFQDEVSPYRVTGMFVLPGESEEIEVVFGPPGQHYELAASAGQVEAIDADRWRWTAPMGAGVYPLTVTDPSSGQSSIINAIVMVPASEAADGRIGDYRIGKYPDTARKKNYRNPTGFIQVTQENQHTLISPHFPLRQFLCKQAGGWPKYVVLQTRLLLKLETLLQQANEHWENVHTFTVMSGYRTPYYNRAIGNVSLSRHMFGDAADIYIDRDGNGRMDDLNGDGKSNYKDATLLATLLEDMTDQPWYQPFLGGLGKYGTRSHRGPFIHVDVRGYRARWNSP